MIGFEECEEFGEGFRVLGTFFDGFEPGRVLLSFWFKRFYLMGLAGIMITLVIPLVTGQLLHSMVPYWGPVSLSLQPALVASYHSFPPSSSFGFKPTV